MASYNELNALIDAYINRNGVQAITGQILNGVLKAMVEQLGRGYTIMGAATPATDPGTPDGPECYFASETGTYTEFDGLQVAPGELALLCYTPTDGWTKATIYEGFREVGATIDGNVGTPSVGVSYADGVLSFDFHNMKGNPGQNGQDGAAAGFGTIGADITGGVGTPAVSVESSGPATAKNLQFHFTNLKGETGVTSVVATVDNTTGTPACTVSLVGQQLTLAFSGLKGAQGDTGSSVDYPFTIVNNLTTDDATQALSAAQGVVLAGQVSQLEAKVTDLTDGASAVNPSVSETSGKYIGYQGTIANDSHFSYTSPFYVEKGKKIIISAKGYLTYTTMIARVITDGVSYTPLVMSIDSTVRTYQYIVTESGYYACSFNNSSPRTITIVENTPELLNTRLTQEESKVVKLEDGLLVSGQRNFSTRGTTYDVVTGLNLYKGIAYKINYEAIGGKYDTLYLYVTDENNTQLKSFSPRDEQDTLSFTLSNNYKNAKIRVVAWGGGSNYGTGVKASVEQLLGIAETAYSNKQSVTAEATRATGAEASLLAEIGSAKTELQGLINSITPIQIEGNVENAPDEEDIADVNNLLRFKDRVSGNGFGYKYIRKTDIFKDVVDSDNTVYVIRYSYDLGGDSVELPENCVLLFDGGMIHDGELVGDDSLIIASRMQIFDNISISGTWRNPSVFSKWFPFAILPGQDDASLFDAMMGLCKGESHTNAYLENKDYYTSVPNGSTLGAITIPSNTTLIISGTIHQLPNSFDRSNLILVRDVDNVEVKGGILVGDKETHTGNTGEWGHGIKIAGADKVRVSNVTVSKFWGDGIDILEGSSRDSMNVILSMCDVSDCRRNGFSIEAGQNVALLYCRSTQNGVNGTPPRAGLDIEPWQAGIDKVRYISVIGCVFADNVGYDLHIIARQAQTDDYDNDIFVRGCTVKNAYFQSAQKCVISDCIITGTADGGGSGFILDKSWYLNKGTTVNRPSANVVGAGFTYFDTDLGKMIVSNGTSWVNMDGTALS